MAKASDPKNQQLNLAEQQTDDIIIEEEEIGVIVERIYQEGGICNA